MSDRLVTDTQAHQLAELWVWHNIVSILEGAPLKSSSAAMSAAQRVIAIAKKQQRYLIAQYDAPIAEGNGNG